MQMWPLNYYIVQIGGAVHEILNALGVYHEQDRSDRDSYLKNKLQNVNPDNLNVFHTKDADNYNVTYDYYSLMH